MTKTLEIPIAELKHALTGLGKVISTRASLPILGYVRIDPDGPDTVRLQGTDLEAYATCRISARNLDNFPACTLPLDQLTKLAKASKGDVALLAEDDGKFTVRYQLGGSLVRTSIDSLPLSEFPVSPVIKSPIHMLDEGFKEALHSALECSSHEGSRYILQGACLDISQPDCHTVVGTDGRHLFAANTFKFQLAGSVIVPDRKFLHWFDFAADGPWSLAVELNEKNEPVWIKLESNRWTFITKAIEGVYPNWRQVIPAKSAESNLTFTTQAIESILEALPCLPTSKQNLPVCLAIQNNEFQLKGRAADRDEWTVVPILGISLIGQPVDLILNRTYLSKALRFGFTELEINAETQPVMFKAPGRKMLISPICQERPAAVPATEPVNQPPNPAEAVIANTSPAVETETSNQEMKTTPIESSSSTAMTMPERGNLKPDQPAPSINGNGGSKIEIVTTNGNGSGNGSATKALIDQLDAVRTKLRDLAGELTETIDLVKAAEKEKRAALKEVENVRTTLRSLQKVQI